MRKVFVCLTAIVGLLFFFVGNTSAWYSGKSSLKKRWNLSTIESPERLARLDSYPVEIVVQLNDKADTGAFRAWLNRRNITERFEPFDGGMRALVGPEDGLKIKKNGDRHWWRKINVLKTKVKGHKRRRDIDFRAFWVEAPLTTKPQVTLPPGYDPEQLTITESAMEVPEKIKDFYTPIGKIYDISLGAGSVDFGDAYVEIRYKYDSAALLEAGIREIFQVFFFDPEDNRWKEVDKVAVDPDNQEITAFISHLTPISLAGVSDEYNIVFVDINNGDDTNDPSIGQNFPMKTIRAGIESAAGLDPPVAVFVAEGVYNVNEPLEVQAGMSLYGGYSPDWGSRVRDDFETVIQDLSTTDRLPTNSAIEAGADVTAATVIDGFIINGGGGERTSAIFCNGGSPTIQNNRISGGSGTEQSYGIYARGSSAVIQNNIVDGGSGGELSFGILSGDESSTTIRKNTIYGGSGSEDSHGIYNHWSETTIQNNIIDGGSPIEHSYGIYNGSAYSPAIRNNTIDSASYGIYNFNTDVGEDYPDSQPIIENNIIFASDNSDCIGIVQEDPNSYPASLKNNDIFCPTLYSDETTGSVYSTTGALEEFLGATAEGNVSIDPGFVDKTGGDWHLKNSAPLAVTRGGLDGAASGWGFSDDRDKTPRTDPWSMGAYENDWVNTPPVASDDLSNTDEDSPVNIDVVANDNDADEHQQLLVTQIAGIPVAPGSIIQLPSGATVTLQGNGTLTYHPNGQFESLGVYDNTPDTFQYTIEDDSGAPHTATVTVTVTGVNDKPLAVADPASIREDAVPNTVSGNVLTNDTDVDSPAGDLSVVWVINDPLAYGSLSFDGDGSYEYTLHNHISAVNELNVGDQLTEEFGYTVSDGNGGEDTNGKLTITITGSNDESSVVTNAPPTVNVGTSGQISQDYLNATDPDDGPDMLTYCIQTGMGPAHGSLEGLTTTTNPDYDGCVTQEDINNGVLSYVHNGDGATSDGFVFDLIDSQGTPVAGLIFDITVNQAPDAETDKLIAVPGNFGDVAMRIAAPSDVNGDPLSATVTLVPDNADVKRADGTPVEVNDVLSIAELTALIVTPGQVPYVGAPGSEFVYAVTDPHGLVTSGYVEIDIYEATAVDWTLASEQLVLASDGSAGDYFGSSVSISGDIAVIGTGSGNDVWGTDTESAYIYQRQSDGMWAEMAYLFPDDGQPDDKFGVSVSISGDTALIGAPFADGQAADSGGAYVFEPMNIIQWFQSDKLISSDGQADDRFGQSVSVSAPACDLRLMSVNTTDELVGRGRSLVVVALVNSELHVRIFDASGEKVVDKAEHQLEDGEALTELKLWLDPFPDESSLTPEFKQDIIKMATWAAGHTGSTRAIVGAQGRASAYIFQAQPGGSWWEPDSWVLEVELQELPEPPEFTFYGLSVAISGETAIVGARQALAPSGRHTGAIYTYERQNNGSWLPTGRLLASDPQSYADFGSAVSISGDWAVVGARYQNESENQRLAGAVGAAYVFKRQSDDSWRNYQKLLPPVLEARLYFGTSVSISGDTLAVGAPQPSHGNGAAYIYRIRIDCESEANHNLIL